MVAFSKPLDALSLACQAAVAQYEKAFEDDNETHFRVKRRIDALSCVTPKVQTTSAGEGRLQYFEWILEHGFSSCRYAFDRLLHSLMVRALARLIIGDDWDVVGPQIVANRSWSHMSQLVIGKAPRRFGKTWANAKAAVAIVEVMLLSPGALEDGRTFTIAVFSTGARASGGFMETFETFLVERGLDQYVKIRRKGNNARIELHQRDDPTSPKVKVNFLPAKAQT